MTPYVVEQDKELQRKFIFWFIPWEENATEDKCAALLSPDTFPGTVQGWAEPRPHSTL